MNSKCDLIRLCLLIATLLLATGMLGVLHAAPVAAGFTPTPTFTPTPPPTVVPTATPLPPPTEEPPPAATPTATPVPMLPEAGSTSSLPAVVALLGGLLLLTGVGVNLVQAHRQH